MAASIHESHVEAALMAFDEEFRRNGFGKAPDGLIRLLKDFALKPGETNADGRARLYKRLWCILWYGSEKTLGSGLPKWPTYVYPDSLKTIIRWKIPGDLAEYTDPSHDSVYRVNTGDLASAKWPAAKKTAKEK